VGLLKTALKTAVAVKTAHVVHDRIQRRQGEKWAAEHPPAAPAAATAGATAGAEPAAALDDTLARLKQLGELRTAGVLTESEFESQKARILGA
jgi:hypothetical protein